MLKIESKIGKVSRNEADMFMLLSDFKTIEQLVPKDKVQDFVAEDDKCSFTVEKLGRVEIEILDKQPYSMIKYSGGGAIPFQFLFWIQFKQVAENDTRIKLTLKAEIPTMVAMMIKGKLQKSLDQVVDSISGVNNYGK